MSRKSILCAILIFFELPNSYAVEVVVVGGDNVPGAEYTGNGTNYHSWSDPDEESPPDNDPPQKEAKSILDKAERPGSSKDPTVGASKGGIREAAQMAAERLRDLAKEETSQVRSTNSSAYDLNKIVNEMNSQASLERVGLEASSLGSIMRTAEALSFSINQDIFSLNNSPGEIFSQQTALERTIDVIHDSAVALSPERRDANFKTLAEMRRYESTLKTLGDITYIDRSEVQSAIRSIEHSIEITGIGPSADITRQIFNNFKQNGLQRLSNYVQSLLEQIPSSGFDTTIEEKKITQQLDLIKTSLSGPAPNYFAAAVGLETVRLQLSNVPKLEESAVGPEDLALIGLQIMKGLAKPAVKGLLKLSLAPVERFEIRKLAATGVENFAVLSKGLAKSKLTQREIAAYARLFRISEEVFVSRHKNALDFIMQHPAYFNNQRKIFNVMLGIDFSQPVEIVRIKKGTILEQWQPLGIKGNFFGDLGGSPASLGISNVAGKGPREMYARVPVKYKATQDMPALKSTANHILDTWSVDGLRTYEPGGAVQYLIDSRLMEKVE